MGWSEEALHRWLLQRPGTELLVGSRGHDAAVLASLRGQPVLCVDQTIEAVHFDADATPEQVGHKAAARALSDLAACAASPRALLLGLSAPRDAEEAWLQAVIDAVDQTARRHGAALVGGDLACAEGACSLSVSALGSLPEGAGAPGRDRAQPGDLVLLSGPVGGAGLGRHLRIEPRLELGAWLFEHGARVLMDVSDGLARDLARIARASNVRIDLEQVPEHPDARRAAQASGRTPRQHALHDGEDHELLACLDERAWSELQAQASARFPGLLSVGRVKRGEGLWLADEAGAELRPWDATGGWLHGS